MAQEIEDLESLIEEIVAEKKSERTDFVPGEDKISLSAPTFGSKEIIESLESLLSTWVTMGDKVSRFENKWANYVGTSHSNMVNSGSSANLLALKSLEGNEIKKGDEVIAPSVSWSTTIFPIADINAKPTLVDVEEDTYTLDIEAVKNAISDSTSAIMPVHLLGNPAEMNALMEIAEDHNLSIIEDCCEAHGAKFDGQKVGSFGDLGTFSFFFSHHISTIEGGAIVTDSDEKAEKLKMLRAHGWIRELEDKKKYSDAHPEIDDRFLFQSAGYNLRPTEISGAFGIHQVEKLEKFVEKRTYNANYLNNRLQKLSDYFHILKPRKNTRCSWFAYPLLIKESAPFSKKDLQQYLERGKIETRPILAGNIARQPGIKKIPHRISGELSSAENIHQNGLFIGNHHELTDKHLDYIADTIEEFVSKASS